MADYIYLLEHRLSQAQQNALDAIREVARERGLTLFLVGGAVRDLTSGSPVRDLDVVVQGNALRLKKDIERAGGVITGEHDAFQALFVKFPGGAEVEIGSTLSVTYPKPGKPAVKPASILDDLRRRDFTANAMALSLNTGSYGLLMDPLNGVADIENRELRLVSNYGFIEDPIRMVRAVRLMARLGWQMDDKTQARYATGKEEGYISAASAFQRGYETEEIVHEEDSLRVMRRLESEGWMALLAPDWDSSKANVAELERLRETQTQLQMQGIYPSAASANFPLLTAKLSPAQSAELKASFPRQGFVREIESLDAAAKELTGQLLAKSSALPSQAWKLLHSATPEAVLLVAHSSKSPAIQAKFKSFYTEWSLAKQKVPYVLLQEMRIVPDLPGYKEFVESLVFELMDGKLDTAEAMKAFLEPFSPPAPPPPVHLRRPRAAKKEAKAGKSRAKKTAAKSDLSSGAEVEVLPIVAPPSLGEVAKQEQVAEPAAPPAKTLPLKPGKTASKRAGEAAPVAEPSVQKARPAKPDALKMPAAAKKAVASSKPVPKPTAALQKSPAKSPVGKKAVPPKKVASAKKSPSKAPAKPTVKTVVKKAATKLPAKKNPAKGPVKKSPAKTVAKSPSGKAASKSPARKTSVKLAAKKRR